VLPCTNNAWAATVDTLPFVLFVPQLLQVHPSIGLAKVSGLGSRFLFFVCIAMITKAGVLVQFTPYPSA